jgi:outer membrane receptor protein involved in Fe transport
VLLNGRRLAPSSFGNFVDISMLPLSAIERVEVLPDGASATYGSDAVGGVINFILRDRYDGMETRLRAGSVTSGHLNEIQASQSLGRAWSTGSVMFAYDHYNRGALAA